MRVNGVLVFALFADDTELFAESKEMLHSRSSVY